VRLGASHHALAPATPDHPLRGFRAGPVVTVERSSGHVIIKLDSTGAELRQQSVKTPTWADRSDWPSSASGAALREGWPLCHPTFAVARSQAEAAIPRECLPRRQVESLRRRSPASGLVLVTPLVARPAALLPRLAILPDRMLDCLLAAVAPASPLSQGEQRMAFAGHGGPRGTATEKRFSLDPVSNGKSARLETKSWMPERLSGAVCQPEALLLDCRHSGNAK